jgi:hypothetical protein
MEERFRFCPWCGAAQRAKIVEFFAAHPLVEQDPAKALRVSRYLGDTEEARHVRFSVWGGGQTPRAEAAVSLTDDEAERLERFVGDTAHHPRAQASRRPVTAIALVHPRKVAP